MRWCQPNAVSLQVLQAMVQQPARGPKRRKLEGDHTDVLTGVKDDTVDEDVLVRRLTDYVERVDTDMVRFAQLATCIRASWAGDTVRDVCRAVHCHPC